MLRLRGVDAHRSTGERCSLPPVSDRRCRESEVSFLLGQPLPPCVGSLWKRRWSCSEKADSVVKFVPHNYQRRAIDFILTHKRCAMHMDVGLGKTTTSAFAAIQLLDTFDVRGVMVFAPKRVAGIAWPSEFQKWDQLRKVRYACLVGKPESVRSAILRENLDFYLLNYDHLPWWVEFVLAERKAGRTLRQDMLILDESSRLKASDSSRFKMLKPLADSSLFPRIVELTGTPSPEDYEDLWSQYRLLDGGKRLETYVTHFRRAYYDQNPYSRYDLRLKPGADKVIQAKIADITVSMRAADYLTLPPILENDIYVDLPPKAREHYDAFEKDMVAQISDETVAAPSAAMVSEKCRQVCSGAVYDETGQTLRLHEEKFDALDELVEDKPGNLLVAYWYKHELETIRKRYPSARTLGPKCSEVEALRTVKEWNDGKIPLLFCHPASTGHGLNLQSGGHHLVWLTIPWSNEIYQQFVGRLYRQGQTKPVTVHRILCRDTVDMVVDSAVKKKEFSQQDLRKALALHCLPF